MRLMEQIRRHGDKGLKFFLVIFLISVFAGLGVGFFGMGGVPQGPQGAVDDTAYRPAPVDPQQSDWALTVNGRKVSNTQFYDRIRQVERSFPQEDPEMQLRMYGMMAQAIAGEEVLLGEAQKHNVRVESKDLTEEKQKVIDQMQPAASSQKSGNVLGQGSQWLTSQREKHALFVNYLQRTGQREDQWQAQVTREILQRKAREALEKEANEAKDVKAKEQKAKIDEELAKGRTFADVAAQYSDAESKSKGGDMGELMPGLLNDAENGSKYDLVLFSTAKGETTDWFDIPAGYQRWQVYERTPLEGAEFDEAKTKIRAALEEQDKEKTITDEEIKKYAFKIKARQIMINATDPEAVGKKIEELNKAAVIEYNNPYVLASQALFEDKIQPPSSVNYEQLVTIAKKSAAKEGYDFTPIKGKLERGRTGATAESEAKSAGDAKAEQGEAAPADQDSGAAENDEPTADAAAETRSPDSAAAEDDAAAEPEADTTEKGAAAPPANPSAPIYALAIGLLEMALEGKDAQATPFGEAVIAATYLKWLKEENDLKTQPVDRDKARAEIEARLASAVDKDEYNARLYADRALNMAWLDKAEDAKKQLELAEKYASDKQPQTLETIKEAYEKLDMGDKAKAIQDRLDKARQEAMMQQIQQQIQMQQQGGGGIPGDASMPPITIETQ